MAVLILILMEHAQRVMPQVMPLRKGMCLNPYFNGTCSKRLPDYVREEIIATLVLILILMEHAQRDYQASCLSYSLQCLNPYFNGTCSKSTL